MIGWSCRARSKFGFPDHTGLLQSTDSSDDRWGMIQITRALGDVLGGPEELNLGDTNGALACYREAAARAEALAGDDPQDVRARRILVASYFSLGRLQLDAAPKVALGYYSKTLAISEDLLRTDESNIEYRRDAALAGLGVARCSRRLGKRDEALRLLARSVELQRPIETAASQRIWMNRPLGWIYLEIGNVLTDRRDAAGAIDNFRAGVEVAERLLKRAPSSLYLQRDLAEALETTGWGFVALAKQPSVSEADRAKWKAAARSAHQKCLAIWQSWMKRSVAAPYAARRLKQASILVASVGSP
jgi:tetratricopeptide (TPR) repeat protein